MERQSPDTCVPGEIRKRNAIIQAQPDRLPPVAEADRLLHIVSDDQRRQPVFFDDLVRELCNQLRARWIERCRMLVKQKHLGLRKCCHEQTQRLTFPAGQ
jgi:hypothetical protein